MGVGDGTVALSSCATLAVPGGPYRELAVFLTFVAVSLVIVIQLQVVTAVELSGRFAIFFAVVVTKALEAVWIVAQSLSDTHLGTDLIESQVQLQWQIVYVTGMAVLVGILYRVLEGTIRLRRAMTAETDDSRAG